MARGILKLVLISDTHNRHREMTLPAGDILIHSGDFLGGPIDRQARQLQDFNAWLGLQPFKHRIVIAGNHDHLLAQPNAASWRACLTNCTYLQDEAAEIAGLRFYGSPWTPDFFREHWVFNQPRRSEETIKRWAKIPDDTQALITHGPPNGVLDIARDMHDPTKDVHVGCNDLRRRIRQLKHLKLHTFGHIHESHGVHEEDGVRFVNASSLNGRYVVREDHYTVVEL